MFTNLTNLTHKKGASKKSQKLAGKQRQRPGIGALYDRRVYYGNQSGQEELLEA